MRSLGCVVIYMEGSGFPCILYFQTKSGFFICSFPPHPFCESLCSRVTCKCHIFQLHMLQRLLTRFKVFIFHGTVLRALCFKSYSILLTYVYELSNILEFKMRNNGFSVSKIETVIPRSPPFFKIDLIASRSLVQPWLVLTWLFPKRKEEFQRFKI